jgi:hypothetical protein
MNRGILSIYWGDESKLPIERLKTSVAKFHPELPHQIIKVEAPSDNASSLNLKASMLDLSPFDETLFLDIDTVVLGDLNFGFEKAKQFGLAIAICESPWAKRYRKIFSGDQIEYNTGVIFFTKAAIQVFDAWKALSQEVDSENLGVAFGTGEIFRQTANDQASFALAIENVGLNPFVLPMNWNFRPMWQKSFCGPIKIWHDYMDPPSFFDEMTKYYSNADSIIQYHQG